MQIILTSAEIKYLFDIKSDGTLTKHKSLGAKEAYLSRNQWDLKEYLIWYLSNVIDSAGGQEDESLRQARLHYWKAKAKEKIFEVEVRKGKFLAMEGVANEWGKRLSNMRSSLLTFVDRLPPMIEGKSRKQISGILKNEIYYFLDQYAQNGKYCPEN